MTLQFLGFRGSRDGADHRWQTSQQNSRGFTRVYKAFIKALFHEILKVNVVTNSPKIYKDRNACIFVAVSVKKKRISIGKFFPNEIFLRMFHIIFQNFFKDTTPF